MAISADEVRAIARLARIQIDEAEIPAFEQQLSRILEFMAQLNSLDTTGVEPLAHPQELAARLRADVVTETDESKDFQQTAPHVENGLYLVPKVIE
jgi:aspartyl-tRNA(Asn)/glutamyl-tRNA(Gln) amidotransferase subunit C